MTDKPNYEDVLSALSRLKQVRGQPTVRATLKSHGNVTAASNLSPEDYQAVIDACEGVEGATVNKDGSLDTQVILKRWNASGAGPRSHARSRNVG